MIRKTNRATILLNVENRTYMILRESINHEVRMLAIHSLLIRNQVNESIIGTVQDEACE